MFSARIEEAIDEFRRGVRIYSVQGAFFLPRWEEFTRGCKRHDYIFHVANEREDPFSLEPRERVRHKFFPPLRAVSHVLLSLSLVYLRSLDSDSLHVYIFTPNMHYVPA